MPDQRFTLNEALDEASTYYFQFEFNRLTARLRTHDWWNTLRTAQKIDYIVAADHVAKYATEQQFRSDDDV